MVSPIGWRFFCPQHRKNMPKIRLPKLQSNFSNFSITIESFFAGPTREDLRGQMRKRQHMRGEQQGGVLIFDDGEGGPFRFVKLMGMWLEALGVVVVRRD
jgi:hypothetical protein